MSQKHKKMAGGMSYRTMDGLNSSEIFKYLDRTDEVSLDGTDEVSCNKVLEKIKDYYMASADKTSADCY